MKIVGIVLLCIALALAMGSYGFLTTANFRTEGSPAGTAMFAIVLAGFLGAFFAGLIGLACLIAKPRSREEVIAMRQRSARRELSFGLAVALGLVCALQFSGNAGLGADGGTLLVVVIAIAWPLIHKLFFSQREADDAAPARQIPSPPATPARDAPVHRAEQSWLAQRNASLGIAQLPDQRCWLLLRTATTCFRAQQSDYTVSGWLTLMLGGYAVRMPKSWSLAPALAQAVRAAWEHAGAMPAGVEWYACHVEADWQSKGPWRGWSELAHAQSPQHLVRAHWVFALAQSRALLEPTTPANIDPAIERWEREGGKKMGMLSNGERALLLAQSKPMGDLRCALDPNRETALQMVAFAIDGATLWVPIDWTLSHNEAQRRLTQFNSDGTQDLTEFAPPAVSAVSRTPWIDLTAR